jgi:cation diffusion facilitator CzcD-associated flavoprotein CzcO
MSQRKIKNGAADLDVIIVGAGFAGLYQLRELRKRGYNVRVIEAGNDIGGTWYWNCYPGARVDTYDSMYQYSAPELWTDWDYSEKYPQWDEVRKYFDYIDSKWGLRRDCQFGTRVTAATFDEKANVWNVKTDDGETTTCRWLMLCIGALGQRNIPDFPGLKSFKGEAHHTSLWPQGGLDVRGKRVGVIGTGASAVQVIQEVSKEAARLTVFQRTPNLAIPMRQEKISKEQNARLKERYPESFEMRAKTFAGFDFDFLPKGALEVSDRERQATYERLWEIGGFVWWLGTFNDVLFSKEANDTQYAFWRDQTRKRIKDPILQEKLAPTVPPHPFGVKRPSLEQWYYECFNQDNVQLVDMNERPIERVTENGVMAGGGVEHKLDILVLATGFDAVSGGLTSIDIVGTDGKTLRERWANGISSHLGMAVDKFPNMLFFYGPQSPSGFCNGPTCAELQSDWAVRFIEDMDRNGTKRVEPTPEVTAAWRENAINIVNNTLFPLAKSWYMGANIPGKPLEILCYPGGLPDYLKRANEVAANGYTGFVQIH